MKTKIEPHPLTECSDETKEWYLSGKLQHADGPAIKCSDESKEWWNSRKHKTSEKS